MKFPPGSLRSISHRDELGSWLVAAGLGGTIAEIGVLHGGYTEVLLRTWPGLVCAVDLWENQPESVYKDGANLLDMESIWAGVRAGIGRNSRCRLMRMASVDAAQQFEGYSLAACYLDANHRLEAVRADISAWFNKVQIGGIFAGHDFYIRDNAETNSDAQTAVLEFAERVGVYPQVTWCNSWWFQKDIEMVERFHATRNR